MGFDRGDGGAEGSGGCREHSVRGARVLVFEDSRDACREAAARLVEIAREAIRERDKAVLGLATGKTPLGVYAALAQTHKEGLFSFRNVTTYNLDEYYPMSPRDPNSYRTFMHRHLFSQVDLAPNRAHVPDGTVPAAFADETGAAYDRWIEADGGLDAQLLGIGRNGHIGFNEPSETALEEALRSPTRLVELDVMTRHDAAADFGGLEQVPTRAVTMGMKSILGARSILVLAFGSNKAGAVANALQGHPTALVPASLLQTVSERVTWMLDPDSARGLDF